METESKTEKAKLQETSAHEKEKSMTYRSYADFLGAYYPKTNRQPSEMQPTSDASFGKTLAEASTNKAFSSNQDE